MSKRTFALIITFHVFLSITPAQSEMSEISLEKKHTPVGQNLDENNKNTKPKISAELEEKAFSLLKSTAREAAKLNLPENRVRYLVETGDLMWPQDQKTARELFTSAISDFRLIMQSLDTLYQKRESAEVDNDSFFGQDINFMRFYSVQRTRQNMLMTIAKYDPQLALDFLNETARANFKDYGWNDASFEAQLAGVIARNEPSRALEIGQQKLAKNSFEGMVDLINNLVSKDAEKGMKLATETAKKLRTTNLAVNQAAYYLASSLFKQAAAKLEKTEKNSEEAFTLSKSETSELAEIVAKAILENSKTNRYYATPSPEELEQLKKYAPTTIAQYEQQAKINKNKLKNDLGGEEPQEQPSPSSMATAAVEQKRENERKVQAEAMSQIMKSVASDEKKSLDEATQALSKIKNRSQRFIAISQIAHALGERGEKEAASNLLSEINSQQVAQPRRAAEMLQNLLIAGANSNINPERSFTMLETTIYELNTVIESFARVSEFIGAKEMMDDNEFAFGGFTGEMIKRGSIEQQIGAEQLILDLAKSDFERTVGLTDKFERPEIRLEARMIVVRTLLANQKTDKSIAQEAGLTTVHTQN